MKSFQDNVAVITGAASGIGKAIAIKCLNLGMKIVLADINKKYLAEFKKEFVYCDARILVCEIDVSEESAFSLKA
jgi:NADP-dependent 3-hydroxy acid dehydrogenase YdfG